MRRLLTVALCLMTASSSAADRTADAKAFVAALAAGKFELAVATFGPEMAKSLTAPQLRATWDSLQEKVGHLRKVGVVDVHSENGLDIALVHCQFEKQPLDVKVVYDAEGRVNGLWFTPAVAAPAPSALPSSVREESVVVNDKTAWALPGTITLPKNVKGKLPAVVLVHGSGPNDRDETVGASRPFRDLAIGLAERGVITLRYEKRTRLYGSKMTQGGAQFTVKDETIDDAVVAANLLRARADVDPAKVVMLGHSLGGYLAPRLWQADQKLAGLVVLAGSTRPLELMIVEQMQYLGAPAEKINEVLLAAEKVTTMTAGSNEMVLGAPAAYWLDLRGYDPVAVAKTVTVPMLVLQGGRDYQVTEAQDFARWKTIADQRVTTKLYPKLNHLFITGEGKSQPSEYATEGHVDKKVIDDVAAFVKALPAKK